MTRFAHRLQRLEARWHQEMVRCMNMLPIDELEALARSDPEATQRFMHTLWRHMWPHARGTGPGPQLPHERESDS